MDVDARIQPPNLPALLFHALTGVGLLIFQTTVAAWIDPWGYGPDFCLVVVVYAGLHVPLTAGAILATGLGLFRDATGGGIFGFHAGILLAIFLGASLARQKLDPAAPWYQMIFIFLFVLAASALTMAGLSGLGRDVEIFTLSWTNPVTITLVSALATAVVGPLIFWFMDHLRPGTEKSSDKRP